MGYTALVYLLAVAGEGEEGLDVSGRLKLIEAGKMRARSATIVLRKEGVESSSPSCSGQIVHRYYFFLAEGSPSPPSSLRAR